MLIKTLTWHSITCIVSITSSMAMQQVIPSPDTTAHYQSETSTKVAVITDQIANRSVKSNRLPVKQAAPQARPAPVIMPANSQSNCKPPIDVLGRCFADAGLHHGLA
jgi:hypothetical protein